ncbi:MAG: hypothetical protein K0R49_68 [Burkholderiales bacterium]|jgi:hypothetical protein|nr:hypothetical protein [Burkholderiales bacterium]
MNIDQKLLNTAQNIAEKVRSQVGALDVGHLLEFGRTEIKKSGSLTKKVQFSTDNTINVGQYGVVIDNIRRDYGSTEDATFSLDEYFPERFRNMPYIVNSIMQGNTGLLPARALGQPIPQVKKLNVKSTTFSAAGFAGSMTFDELDMFLRNLSAQDISENGLDTYLIYNQLKLLTQLYSRKKLLTAQAAMLGQIEYEADGQFDFQANYGIPSQNIVHPISGNWLNPNNTVNQNAMPFQDLSYILDRYPPFYKFRSAYMRSGKLIMNPNTADGFLNNNNNNSWAKNIFGNAALFKRATMDMWLQHMYPSGNLQAVIEDDMYVDDDEVSHYTIPDGKILIAFDSASHGGSLGEFVFVPAAQKGGLLNAKPGIYTLLEDCSVPGSRGGVGNPFVNIIAGFNGLPRIANPNNMLIIDVLAINNSSQSTTLEEQLNDRPTSKRKNNEARTGTA